MLSTPGSSLLPFSSCQWTFACCVTLLAQAQFGDVGSPIMCGSFRLGQAVVCSQNVDHAVLHASRSAHIMQACDCVSGLIIGSVGSVASVPNAAPVSVRTLCCGVPTPQRTTPCICSVCWLLYPGCHSHTCWRLFTCQAFMKALIRVRRCCQSSLFRVLRALNKSLHAGLLWCDCAPCVQRHALREPCADKV